VGVRDKKSFAPVKSSILPVLLSGVFAIVLHYGFTYIGLGYSDSSKVAIIKQIGALFYVCFSFIFFKQDRPTLQKIIAVVIGFLGIIALNVSDKGFTFSIGDLLILGASFCTVFSNVISKKVFAKVSPITSTGVSQLFGGVVLMIAGLIMGGKVNFTLDWSILIFVYICVASIISYCIWFGIVKNGELSKLFIIKFAEPVFACVFGAIILGENIFRIQYLVAFLLISFGIWFSNVVLKKRKDK
jgi:drug/metabolite transporter (DMT)-like permease